MSFNYSNFGFLKGDIVKIYVPVIFTPKPEECDIGYKELEFLISPFLQSKNQKNSELPNDKWFRVISTKEIEQIKKLFKMDQRKILKYKNMNPKLNPQIHEIDQNLPKSLYNLFVYKYNKLYHKIEIL
jgi:hypothetical protein